jgi:hypothetical protein
MSASTNSTNSHFDGNDLQPRPKPKKRRNSADRGLPPDAELKRLAKSYLELQRA